MHFRGSICMTAGTGSSARLHSDLLSQSGAVPANIGTSLRDLAESTLALTRQPSS